MKIEYAQGKDFFLRPAKPVDQAQIYLHQELEKLNITWQNVTVLQDKDGVTVARAASGGETYVVKCFQNADYRREIQNYQILSALGVPTIGIIASTDAALLLEDIDRSPIYRLGLAEDLSSPKIARRIAVWYQKLHSLGEAYVFQHGEGLYDEADSFTLENIAWIQEKTGTQAMQAWAQLKAQYEEILSLLHRVKRTLTYNDFYYTNLVVAKDLSSALMFDYNLLGKGYAYADVRNVLSSLSKEAGAAFLEAYGAVDPLERALDDVVSMVTSLFFACQREQFPRWAQGLLQDMKTSMPGNIANLRRFL